MGGSSQGAEKERGRGRVLTKEAKLQNADAHATRTDACAPLTFGPLRRRLLSYVYKRVLTVYC